MRCKPPAQIPEHPKNDGTLGTLEHSFIIKHLQIHHVEHYKTPSEHCNHINNLARNITQQHSSVSLRYTIMYYLTPRLTTGHTQKA